MSRNPIYIKMINSTRWKKLRAEKLRNNPICEECDANGCSTLAAEVHHIIPVESLPHEINMRQLMFDNTNLQSLCHACHAEIHRQMFSQSKKSAQMNQKRATERFVARFLK